MDFIERLQALSKKGIPSFGQSGNRRSNQKRVSDAFPTFSFRLRRI